MIMKATNKSTVNLSAPEKSILKILPRPPVLSSHHLNWDGIYLQHHQQPACETPETCGPQHVIHVSHRSVSTERMMDGRRQREDVTKGDIVIVPANIPHKVNIHDDEEFTLLFLDPAHIAKTIYEFTDKEIELLPCFAQPDPIISTILQELKSELEVSETCSRIYVDSIVNMLMVNLIRRYSRQQQTLPNYTDGLSNHRLRQAVSYINDNLTRDLCLKDIASEVGMSSFYFAHLFRQSIGSSPHQYVMQRRIEKAKHLLEKSNSTLTEIAMEVGFKNQSHFTKVFRNHTSLTPKLYREVKN